jgi:hypothetical protein
MPISRETTTRKHYIRNLLTKKILHFMLLGLKTSCQLRKFYGLQRNGNSGRLIGRYFEERGRFTF